jgi:uncharacterized protein YceH (UPF0502 family)
MLQALMEREEPLVKQVPASPGSRAEKFTQLLCTDAPPVEAATLVEVPAKLQVEGSGLESRVTHLEAEVESLKKSLQSIKNQLGIADATVPSPGTPGKG